MWVRGSWLVRASSLDPLRAGVFNAVGGRCVPPHQDALTWYVTTESCCVSVSCFGARDPGGAEWSCRPCFGPVFGRVSVSPSSRGHLTLAVASHGAPRGAGAAFGSINRHLLVVCHLSYLVFTLVEFERKRGEKNLKGTVGLQACDLLGIACGGRRPASLLSTTGARR
jgi:hypothetical protein